MMAPLIFGLAQAQSPPTPFGSRGGMFTAAFYFVMMLLFMILLASISLRRYLQRESRSKRDEFAPPAPASDQPAFATASMQAVIQRLREQEKELERLHREEKDRARQSERVSEAVTRNMPTGMLLVGSTGLISYSNPAAEAVLGMHTLQYRRYTEALGPGSDLSRILAECLAYGTTHQRQTAQHATPAGEVRRLGVTVSPVLDPKSPPPGRITGAVCLLTDLTELAALQQQVRLKESLAALGEMSAGIAHEFKNALATIAGNAQLLRSESLAPEQAECAERILSETQSLTRVVTEFLRFARPLEAARAPLELGPLVERVVAEAREAFPGVEFACQGPLPVCAGDETLLRQALNNLLRNAAEAACEGAAAPAVALISNTETSGEHSWLRIAVRDNGPGIPEADLAKIFLPFYTTKSGGTGLGLALVQKIVLHHGGAVQARNLPAGGAEILLSLPIQHAPETPVIDSSLPPRLN
jgi:signal transduction histidine kinase